MKLKLLLSSLLVSGSIAALAQLPVVPGGTSRLNVPAVSGLGLSSNSIYDMIIQFGTNGGSANPNALTNADTRPIDFVNGLTINSGGIQSTGMLRSSGLTVLGVNNSTANSGHILGGTGNYQGVGSSGGSSIGGGISNYCAGDVASIWNGRFNTNTSDFSSGIFAGHHNNIGGVENFQILGGLYNSGEGEDGHIGSGWGNVVYGEASSIDTGMSNAIYSGVLYSSIVSGGTNIIEDNGLFNFIAGGFNNRIRTNVAYGTIIGNSNQLSVAKTNVMTIGYGLTNSVNNTIDIGESDASKTTFAASGITVRNTITVSAGTPRLIAPNIQLGTVGTGVIPALWDGAHNLILEYDQDNLVFKTGEGVGFSMLGDAYTNAVFTSAIPWFDSASGAHELTIGTGLSLSAGGTLSASGSSSGFPVNMTYDANVWMIANNAPNAAALIVSNAANGRIYFMMQASPGGQVGLFLVDEAGNGTFDSFNKRLTSATFTVLDWLNGTFNDPDNGNTAVDAKNQRLVASDGSTINHSWGTVGVNNMTAIKNSSYLEVTGNQTNLNNVVFSNSAIANGIYAIWNGLYLRETNPAIAATYTSVGTTGVTNVGGSGFVIGQDSGNSWMGLYKNGDYTCIGRISSVEFALSDVTDSGIIKASAAGGFGISSVAGAINNADVFLLRDSAATWQLGADSDTAIAQTIKSADGSGTDKVGANLTTEGGQSTGTGRGGALIRKTSLSATSTGSGVNAYVYREHIEPKRVNLTAAAATLVFNISLAAGKYCGIHVFATTDADDGTDFNVTVDEFLASAVNKGGTVTTASSTIGTQTTATASSSVSTMTTAWTVVANGNGLDVKCNATSTLTETTLATRWRVQIDTDDSTLTVTPQ